LAAAGEFLNDALIEFNHRVYECNKIGPTVVTLTGGVGALPTLFFKEHECTACSATGAPSGSLTYIDWAEFNHTWSPGGAPSGAYYTLFNTHITGQIQTLPAQVPVGTGLSYVRITYYRRFALMAAETDILDAPQELTHALVLKAQANMIRVYKSGDPAAFGATDALAERAWARFVSIDSRHPDMKPRFRLPGPSRATFPWQS
jgi:hypothetical protein